jgi:prevent-host-death family protein
MTRLNVQVAKKSFGDTLNRVAYGKERIVIERRGVDVAVILPLEDLRLLERLAEEYEDRMDAEDAARAEADPRNAEPVAWDAVKVRLGL